MASLSTALVLFLCCIALRSMLAGGSQEDSSGASGGEKSGGIYSGRGGTYSGRGGTYSGRGGTYSGSGGTYSGSGSSSSGGLDNAEECVASVLTPDDHEGESIINSTAYMDVMCNLLCMERVTNNSMYQDAEIEERTIGGVWRFRFFPEFSSDNVNTNCPAYRQLAECVRGCMVRVEPNATGLSGNKCKKECKSQCNYEVRHIDNYYSNPHCQIDCNNTICRKGCDTYEMIQHSGGPGTPPNPVTAPSILSEDSMDPSMSLLRTAPPANDQEHPLTPVGIVYRIRDQNTHITSYFGKVDPEEPLDLEQYECRDISLSFVVVNKFGVSQESLPLAFRVSGEPLSIKPTDITVGSVRLDKRPGFFGHVFLTISWQHPPGYVEHYTVKAFPFGSGNSNCYTSPRLNTTTLTVNSEKESDSVFVLGKRLDILVCSVVENPEPECEIKKYNIPEYGELEQNQVRITGCIPQWNGTLFNYTLHWKVPEFVAFGSGIFSRFSLLVERILGRNERYIDQHYVQKSPNQTSYSYTWKNLKPEEAQFDYEFEVSIEWASLTYQPPSTPVSCVRQAVPPPPSPVVNVTLSGLVIDESIEFVFEWKPPVTTNGQLTHYFCCLGGRTLNPFENYDPSTIPLSDKNDTHCVALEPDKTSAVWNHRAPRPDCLYFQMRAHTKFGGGNWSEVVIISHGEINLEGNCNFTKVETPTVTDLKAQTVMMTPTMTTTDLKAQTVTVTPTLTATGSIVDLQDSPEQPSSMANYKVVLAVVGGILAVIVSVALLVMTVMYARIRRRKMKIRYALQRQASDETDLMFTGGRKKPAWPQQDSLITTDEWEIPPSQVLIESRIGEGAFGEVMKGTVKGPLSNPKVPRALKSAICIPVAIKILKSSAKGSEKRDFLQEIEMMKKVSEGQNPHVVSMVGCVTVQEPLSLITEFVPYGNLLQYLRTNQKMYTDPREVPETSPYVQLGNVNSADLISFAYQIASGMEYLSSLGIVHRDLASRNILVGEGKVLKITDLGMSRETDEVYVQKTKGRVPLKWMAVESIITREFTSASDVWAYGVVLWEIGTLGGFPYPSIQNEDLLPLLKRGYRMEKPDNCSSEVYSIMLECWQEEPGKRPTFPNLRARFDSMLLAEKKETYIDLQIDASKPYYNPDLSTESDTKDGFLHVAKKSPKSGSRVSATSPFHARGITPSHSDFFEFPDTLEVERSPKGSNILRTASLELTTDRKNVYVDNPSTHHPDFPRSPVILRGQRSPQGQTLEERFPRPASLQLVTERKNVYVDDPSSLRRSVCISPPQESSSSGYLEGARNPGQMDRNVDEASERGVANSRSDGSAVPQILISLT